MRRVCTSLLVALGGVAAVEGQVTSSLLASATATGSATSSLVTATTSSATSVTQEPVSTASPSATASPGQALPSQAVLAPRQAWCPSEIFCNGAVLQTVNIAQVYPDSKTFVDKPTNGTSNRTLTDFYSFFGRPTSANATSNATYAQLENFLQVDFKGEGLELQPLQLENYTATPNFLNHVKDPLVKAWAGVVNSYWTQLARGTNAGELCDNTKCESTLIPLNHTFVVPGGRFREQYYWDSFWIVEGLIRSQLYSTINSSLQNFMDELEHIGFIPNGGRIYYLNRSQPPLFMKMLYAYVVASKDTGILDRALPLAEVELAWWTKNRTVSVTSPYSKKKWNVARYAVVNTAPRPEGFLPDYLAANGPDITTPYTESEKQALYAELASGAESGWDFSTRWVKNAYAGNATNTMPILRTLNVRNTIPVDLNSILYDYRILLADLYDKHNSKSSKSLAKKHRAEAATLRSAILDLFWDSKRLAFYDFNMTSHARGTLFSAAHYYPFWNDIIPDEVAKDKTGKKAFGAVGSALNFIMRRYNGTVPATLIESGLQWDAPNTWPPHQYIAMQALLHLPKSLKLSSLSSYGSDTANSSSYSLIPPNQLGLPLGDIPAQPVTGGGSSTGDINTLPGSTVVNGGNATKGETWAATLSRELANRYISSAFCSWYATGGSIPGILNQLSEAELNVTGSVGGSGHMFEKFNSYDVDSSGTGGEYTVQAGFGWTNGVVLWAADVFGGVLVRPNCPTIHVNQTSAIEFAKRDGTMFTGRRKSKRD